MNLAIMAVLGGVLALALGFLAAIRFFEKRPKKLKREVYRQYWKTRILSCLNDPEKYALAVIEADKLMDRAFKERGFAGQTTGERLAAAGRFLSQKERVWRVHKLRNRLVHEMDVELNKEQTKRALAVFVRALKDLGAL